MPVTRSSGRRAARICEGGIETIIRLCGWSAIAVVVAIVSFVLYQAGPAAWRATDWPTFFTSAEWRPEAAAPTFGALALFAGTASVTALAMLLSVPTGLGAAIFVSEFCGPRTRETLKVVIELLAAIPSVVWGFIAYTLLSPALIAVTGAPVGVNVLNGGIVLAFMSVPIIMSMGEDALKAVPDPYREAALALGASRWQVVYRVLLPAARHGLLAAVLLGIGRAIGETMAVLMATGHSIRLPLTMFDPARTLTATIAAELGEAVAGGPHYRMLFVLGAMLMAMSLAVNVTADLLVRGLGSSRSDEA
jgi:phosphate transport system permease protein